MVSNSSNLCVLSLSPLGCKSQKPSGYQHCWSFAWLQNIGQIKDRRSVERRTRRKRRKRGRNASELKYSLLWGGSEDPETHLEAQKIPETINLKGPSLKLQRAAPRTKGEETFPSSLQVGRNSRDTVFWTPGHPHWGGHFRDTAARESATFL